MKTELVFRETQKIVSQGTTFYDVGFSDREIRLNDGRLSPDMDCWKGTIIDVGLNPGLCYNES
jgi:hypothetical protein